MTPTETDFVNRMGLVMETLGAQRTMGRLYGWLMICDPPHQTLTDLAATLEVSKTSISTVARQLTQAEMIERIPTGSREHAYRITPGGWTRVLRAQNAGVRMGIEVLEYGLKVLGPDRARQRELLTESRDFFAFTGAEVEKAIQLWEKSRAKTEESGE